MISSKMSKKNNAESLLSQHGETLGFAIGKISILVWRSTDQLLQFRLFSKLKTNGGRVDCHRLTCLKAFQWPDEDPPEWGHKWGQASQFNIYH
jgi:hypothetical protein